MLTGMRLSYFASIDVHPLILFQALTYRACRLIPENGLWYGQDLEINENRDLVDQ